MFVKLHEATTPKSGCNLFFYIALEVEEFICGVLVAMVLKLILEGDLHPHRSQQILNIFRGVSFLDMNYYWAVLSDEEMSTNQIIFKPNGWGS